MTALYDYIIASGTIVQDTTDLLTDVQGEWTAALGANLDLDASTPQGTLIAAETIARVNVMKNNADMANVINPQLSYGVFLDAICALCGVTRGEDSYTTATVVTFTGAPGNQPVTVPQGSRVQTSNGDIFTVGAPVTIPSTGTVVGTLQSQEFGSFPLPLGNLTILDGVIGWGACTVTVNTIVAPGTLALTDAQLKNVRIQRLAALGVGSSAAVMAAVSAVPGVTSVQVVENNTGATGTVNGVTFTLPSALWVCVSGTATKNAISAAMYAAHQGGCPWDYGGAGMGTPVDSPNGTPALDPTTGLSYNTKYVTPIMYDAYVNITVHPAAGVATPISQVSQSIFEYAAGMEDGEPGLIIGADVSAFEMSGAVARNIPGMYIKSCQVACVPAGSAAPSFPSAYSYEVVIGQFQQAQLAIGNITVNEV